MTISPDLFRVESKVPIGRWGDLRLRGSASAKLLRQRLRSGFPRAGKHLASPRVDRFNPRRSLPHWQKPIQSPVRLTRSVQ
jgi:hypothetical protein